MFWAVMVSPGLCLLGDEEVQRRNDEAFFRVVAAWRGYVHRRHVRFESLVSLREPCDSAGGRPARDAGDQANGGYELAGGGWRFRLRLLQQAEGQLFCLDAKSGVVRWTTEGRGGQNAALQSAGPNLLVLTTDGDLIVAKRNPDKFDELHRYKVADSSTWAQPVVLKNGLVVRNADSVTCWAF